jgi:putative exosortase-associated protein (TIGR04073 family)
MKKFLLCSLLLLTVGACYADIQDPPANDYGPTRKLSRALANICPLTASTEIFVSMADVNNREGNASAATYGAVKGFGRVIMRFGFGFYELVTFPFPTYKGSYRPFFRSNIPWIHGGYEEFPPELGWKTEYNYVQQTDTSYN